MPTNPGRTAIPAFRRAARVALLALGVLAAQATPALANSHSEAPAYTLSIVEGESTLPEYQILSTSGSVHPSAPVAVSIVRGGLVVARGSGSEGGVWLSQVPLPGDVVSLESPVGNVVGSVVYDGLPSIDSTVCAGSTSFSGVRSGGEPVEGGYYSLELHTDHYGHTERRQTGSGSAQVTVLSGSTYAGNFLAPLQIGQTVWASESLQTPLAGGATFTYSSENARPVGACPVPPAPSPPPPPAPALGGSLLKLLRTTIHRLLVSGWTTLVSINQPGTVTEDLFQQGGAIPARASSVQHGARHRRHPRRPPALLLARGSATAASAGTVSVKLHATANGRRVLKHMGSVRAVLVTTLSTAGAKKVVTLEQRTVTLHR